ncbi:MAG: hypothetical protein NZ891_00150 [bacterium]|nr:hypothetical protein [bacterium]MDW8163145.1 hypothetical protein [Candidatus Omnitrophota bacterium]
MKKIMFLLLILSFILKGSEKIIKIDELYERGEKYDNKEVIIVGEAIGDIMGQGNEKWVNIKDEFKDIAIGVVISKQDIEKIKNLGKYRVKGDIVKIYGTYNMKCTKHMGERDIHALRIEIIKRGEILPSEVKLSKIIISFFLLTITVTMMFLSHKRAKMFK